MTQTTSCILSKFYIKPQLSSRMPAIAISCILSKFYIKPQLRHSQPVCLIVVSYRNSTSNHNNNFTTEEGFPLYLIEILHQTTTKTFATRLSNRCILSKFYIKPQQISKIVSRNRGCILSKFYIKPQRC